MNSEIRRLGLDASYAAAGNEDLVQNALCPICHDYIEDARETDCAARHVFCGPCIKDVSDRNQPCPCCRGQFSKTERPQGLMRSFIEQVKWKCLNFENGCAFTGTKKQLEKHLDDDCAVQEFKCPFSGCQEKMRRGALDAHKNTCPYRLLPCFFCQAQVRFNCMTAHRDRCPKFPIPCPKMCGQNVPRWQVSQHFERECAEQVLDCRVSGCGERVKRKLMDQHEDDNMKRHLKLVYTELAKQEQQRKSLQTEIAQLKSHWHFAQLHSPSLTDDCLELTVRLPDFETKSAGMVRGEGQFLHSVRFLFQVSG
uniref:RING-type domain-containing protein n=1 Tax=Chromera velia CCMP2878 TaxID=1169474 RepID=A0A0G4FFS5_9ALVE|eukprot:Cvel_3275.t1-p1 / transcript=Cvel_3275.t1 / gene=Cvel_3275 / organism=Chromera_velia_CCMP2878 / gene_product=TNF receptor-associated factor 4, putative / transcript_product=TNF receptor-associated factor 4, putative / location=Cvel_scaffold128:128876-129999(+) / protein_length=309 / sequence_SO=supercontig / SO=protein_coding / is_pseudo=false